MTPYDAAMVGLVVAGMIWGALRGITWQLASLASLVLGYAVAVPLSAQLAPRFPGEPAMARGLALLAVYAGVSGGVFLAAWLVRATLRRWQFEAYDRHLGMVLGGLEGAVVGVVATLFLVSLAPQVRAAIFASPSGRVVGKTLDALAPILPGEVHAAVVPYLEPGSGSATVAEVPPPVAGSAPTTPPEVAEAAESAGSTAGGGWQQLLEEERARLGRAAGEALRNGIETGDAPGLRDVVEQERARLGRVAGEVLEREIGQVGNADGRTAERR